MHKHRTTTAELKYTLDCYISSSVMFSLELNFLKTK